MKYCRKSVNPVAAVLALGFVLLMTRSVSAKVMDRVIAKVNGEIITLSTVQERVGIYKQQLGASENPPNLSDKEIIEKTLNSIIEERLQLQEAKKSGLEVDDESIKNALKDIMKRNNIDEAQMEAMLEQEGRTMEQYKTVISDQILVTKVVQFHMGKSGKATKKQIKKYYFENQKEFWTPMQPFVRHILFIAEEDATPLEKQLKKDKATEILSKVRAGQDFSELAKKYSEDVSASTGGEIGAMVKGQFVPEFEEVAFKLKPGEVSDIVESRYGYHIIKVDKVIPGKSRPLDEVKTQIEQMLEFKNKKQKYTEWMDELKKDSMIQISLFEDERSKDNPNKDIILEKATSSKSSPKRRVRAQAKNNWEEASNVRNKGTVKKLGLKKNKMVEIKNRLAFIKRLRKHEKITEEEYQDRKQKLLDQL